MPCSFPLLCCNICAESTEFATSREEIEEDYKRRLKDWKKRHSRNTSMRAPERLTKQASMTNGNDVRDSDPAIDNAKAGEADAAVSVKESDMESQVCVCACTCMGWVRHLVPHRRSSAGACLAQVCKRVCVGASV